MSLDTGTDRPDKPNWGKRARRTALAAAVGFGVFGAAPEQAQAADSTAASTTEAGASKSIQYDAAKSAMTVLGSSFQLADLNDPQNGVQKLRAIASLIHSMGIPVPSSVIDYQSLKPAIQELQRQLGVHVDGQFGPATLRAVRIHLAAQEIVVANSLAASPAPAAPPTAVGAGPPAFEVPDIISELKRESEFTKNKNKLLIAALSFGHDLQDMLKEHAGNTLPPNASKQFIANVQEDLKEYNVPNSVFSSLKSLLEQSVDLGSQQKINAFAKRVHIALKEFQAAAVAAAPADGSGQPVVLSTSAPSALSAEKVGKPAIERMPISVAADRLVPDTQIPYFTKSGTQIIATVQRFNTQTGALTLRDPKAGNPIIVQNASFVSIDQPGMHAMQAIVHDEYADTLTPEKLRETIFPSDVRSGMRQVVPNGYMPGEGVVAVDESLVPRWPELDRSQGVKNPCGPNSILDMVAMSQFTHLIGGRVVDKTVLNDIRKRASDENVFVGDPIGWITEENEQDMHGIIDDIVVVYFQFEPGKTGGDRRHVYAEVDDIWFAIAELKDDGSLEQFNFDVIDASTPAVLAKGRVNNRPQEPNRIQEAWDPCPKPEIKKAPQIPEADYVSPAPELPPAKDISVHSIQNPAPAREPEPIEQPVNKLSNACRRDVLQTYGDGGIGFTKDGNAFTSGTMGHTKQNADGTWSRIDVAAYLANNQQTISAAASASVKNFLKDRGMGLNGFDIDRATLGGTLDITNEEIELYAGAAKDYKNHSLEAFIKYAQAGKAYKDTLSVGLGAPVTLWVDQKTKAVLAVHPIFGVSNDMGSTFESFGTLNINLDGYQPFEDVEVSAFASLNTDFSEAGASMGAEVRYKGLNWLDQYGFHADPYISVDGSKYADTLGNSGDGMRFMLGMTFSDTNVKLAEPNGLVGDAARLKAVGDMVAADREWYARHGTGVFNDKNAESTQMSASYAADCAQVSYGAIHHVKAGGSRIAKNGKTASVVPAQTGGTETGAGGGGAGAPPVAGGGF